MVVRLLVTIVVTLVLHGAFVLYVRPTPRALHKMPLRSRVAADFARLPLAFEANRGQVDSQVRFLSRGDGYTLFITPDEAVLRLRAAHPSTDGVLRMRLAGGNLDPVVSGFGEQPAQVNYFIGADPARWRTGIPAYSRVAVRDVYPGIDLVYYGNQHELEYDFVVEPESDAGEIRMAFDGADAIEIDHSGDALLRVGDSAVRLRKPVAYQDIDGERRDVEARFVLDAGHITFALGPYDDRAPLVIDPVLIYSRAIGGSHNNSAQAVAVDRFGYAYVAGETDSCDFPQVNEVPDMPCGFHDIFVAKFDPAGSFLVYASVVGGAEYHEWARGIAVDAIGHAYVTGTTSSHGFPTTPGAAQRERNLGLCTPTLGQGCSLDGFAFKLAPSGSALVYSTLLGGSSHDEAFDIAVDAAGNAYVSGTTASHDFPTRNAFQPQLASPVNDDAFVVKVNPAGSAFEYATLLGGSNFDRAYALAIDAAGHAYVAGITGSADFPLTQGVVDESRQGEVFLAKLHESGSSLIYSMHFGGSGFDEVHAMTVDSGGRAHLTGLTWSADFPTRNALRPNLGDTTPLPTGWVGDGFVATVNATGTDLDYSTYLGGTRPDIGTGIGVDTSGRIFVTGATLSVDFPVTADAADATCGTDANCDVTSPNSTTGWYWDAFLAVLDPAVGGTESLVYGTYLGGRSVDYGFGLTLDLADDVYVVGYTNSTDFTNRPPIGSETSFSRAFATKFRMGDPPVELSIGDALITEGDTGPADVTVRVTLSRVSTRDLTVDYATADGTASHGSDYQQAAGRLTIPAGAIEALITLRVDGENVAELDEQFSMVLSNPLVGATIARATGIVTIVDDDRPLLTMTGPAPTVEGAAGATTGAVFTLRLSAPLPNTLNVNYSTSDGTARAPADYTARSGVVTFLPGETARAVPVTVLGDAVHEPNETFSLRVVFAPGIVSVATGTVTATIVDDDPLPRIDSFTPVDGRIGTVVTISGAFFAGAFDVRFNTCPAAFTLHSATRITATLPAGACSGPISVTTAAGRGTSATVFYVLPGIGVLDTSVTEGDSGTVAAVFRVRLTQPAPRPISVQYTTVDGSARAGSDYIATSGVLAFATGQLERTIVVSVRGDHGFEMNESFGLVLLSPVNALLSRAWGVGTIYDDDHWFNGPPRE
jgi:hypothetical protein